MLGPVQLIMVGFRESEMPTEVRSQAEALQSNPAIRLLDVYMISKDRRGNVTQQRVNGIMTGQPPDGSGEFIDQLMTTAAAAKRMSSNPTSGHGYLMRGDPIPDRSFDVPEGTNVLVLLLEHRWATPLWNAVRESTAFPVDDAWMGRESLKAAGLVTENV
jgi:hypothetical protein